MIQNHDVGLRRGAKRRDADRCASKLGKQTPLALRPLEITLSEENFDILGSVTR